MTDLLLLDQIERSLRAALADVERLREQQGIGLPSLSERDDRRRPEDVDDLITPSQAAGRCGVTDHTVRRWLRDCPDLGKTVGGRKFLSISRLRDDGKLKH